MSNKNFSHQQTFADLDNSYFTAREAADYLDISLEKFIDFIIQNGMMPLFSLETLRSIKNHNLIK